MSERPTSPPPEPRRPLPPAPCRFLLWPGEEEEEEANERHYPPRQPHTRPL